MKSSNRATPVALLAFGALAFTLSTPGLVTAQDSSVLGAAIAQTCGVSMDPETQGVLAGVVADSLTMDPLPNARVKIVWQGEDDLSANSATVDTDAKGFYAFCGVPGNVMVLLTATLRVSSPARTVLVEPGMLTVEAIYLAVSDPTKPGLVVGRVIDDATRAPIEGVAVQVGDAGGSVLTNSRGYFVIGERPAGTYRLRITHLAYEDREVSFHVAGNLTQSLEIPLTTRPIELPGITVTAAPTRYRKDLEGLIRRMDMGFGDFITRETLERRPEARLSDFVREIPGVLVFMQGQRAAVEVRGSSCTPDVFLDGIPFDMDPEVGLNQLFIQELEAIEVYKGQEVPGEFLKVGFQRPCMAIVIWSRRGT